MVLLDLMLPGLSGEGVLPHIKGVPVIVLSAKVDVQDKVNLLLGGAADYMTKPFGTKELLARITVQLRKAEKKTDDAVLTVGDLRLDAVSQVVTVQGQAVRLTRTEFAILKLLMSNPKQVISKNALLDRISLDTPDCPERSLKQHISNLRIKLQDASGIMRNGEPYVITPLHLVWNGDCYYMVGVYDYKHQLGSFRVDRIAKCPIILNEEGTLPPRDFNIDEYINTTFRVYNSEDEDVELVCDNTVMDSIIDRFGEDVTTYANDMTTFRAVVKVAVSHVFYSWVFGFGGKVKIKGPENVRSEYRKMLSEAVENLV